MVSTQHINVSSVHATQSYKKQKVSPP